MNAHTSDSTSGQQTQRRNWLVGMGAAAAATLAACYGRNETLFTRLDDARHAAAELRLEFNKAADASNLAVMSDVKEKSVGFAAEAERARQAARQQASSLQEHLQTLGYQEELRVLQDYRGTFDEYERLDRKLLPLAGENTNVMARKLSYGPALQEADSFSDALESMARSSTTDDRCRVWPLVHIAVGAVDRLEVLHAPHIAEADDAVMSRLEKQMAGQEDQARQALKELASIMPGSAPLAEANAAFDRFLEVHRRILALSRKNTNVVTLAMSLGQMRALTTSCDSSLSQLQRLLERRGAAATR